MTGLSQRQVIDFLSGPTTALKQASLEGPENGCPPTWHKLRRAAEKAEYPFIQVYKARGINLMLQIITLQKSWFQSNISAINKFLSCYERVEVEYLGEIEFS